jgi:hypothetical protein
MDTELPMSQYNLVNFSHIPKFENLGHDKTTPLTGISPRDSKEQKRKQGKGQLKWNGFDERCIRHHD